MVANAKWANNSAPCCPCLHTSYSSSLLRSYVVVAELTKILSKFAKIESLWSQSVRGTQKLLLCTNHPTHNGVELDLPTVGAGKRYTDISAIKNRARWLVLVSCCALYRQSSHADSSPPNLPRRGWGRVWPQRKAHSTHLDQATGIIVFFV